MTLKKATLAAIVGQIIAIIPTILSYTVNISKFFDFYRYFSLTCYVIGTGTIVLFLLVLYKKQK
jgi:hypothetical protein